VCEEYTFSYLVSELLDSALILADSLDCIYTSSLLDLYLSLELAHLCGRNECRHLFELVKSDVKNLLSSQGGTIVDCSNVLFTIFIEGVYNYNNFSFSRSVVPKVEFTFQLL
jgi:hypothetical protein